MRILTGEAQNLFPMVIVLGLLVVSALPVIPVLAAPGQPQGGQSAPAIAKAPVYLHAHPKHLYGVQGGSVTVTGKVVNSGTFAFTATSCILLYRLGTSGAWTKAGVCLTPSDFPVTFPAGSTTKASGTQKISDTFPTGIYEWKLVLVGTYNGVASESHAAKLIVTIT